MNYQMNLSTSTTCVKPVFVARAERERLALERKQEQAGKQRHLGGQEQDRVIERRKRKGEEYDNAREQERFEKLEEEKEKKREKEVEFIKEQYLGSKKAKRYVAKPSDKSRFSSDWENSADTSRDLVSVDQTPREAQLLFGRGFRAGIDRREQKRHGVDDPAANCSRNQAAASSYETFDMRNANHWSNKKLEEMTERDWRIFKEDTDISYKGSRIPDPMRNWEESNLSSELLRAVKRQGFTTPSPIQMAAIPVGLQQRDVIGVAETGSGKTAAFVLPMLSYIASLPPITEMNKADGPYALVLAPTRELAQQIKDETLKLAHYMGIKVLCIVGGESIEEQAFNITQGCEIVIATPNRLLHCLGSRYIVLNQCNYIVLDEADRMIDFCFEQQIAGILDAMPSSNLKPENEDEVLEREKIYRTTYMFSATMSSSVERLAKKYLRNPVVITIGTAGKATDRITQNVIMMEETKKMSKLLMLLDDLCESRAIVFVNTKVQAITLAKQLDRAGYKVTALHGKNSQQQRQISLDGFRSRRYNVLVATDVAARGLDIPDVTHVINYDAPWTIEMYTHRIGRTGRAGKKGVATTFLTSKDTDLFFDLKQMLIQSNCPVPPQLARHEASKLPRFTPGKPSGRSATAFGHY